MDLNFLQETECGPLGSRMAALRLPDEALLRHVVWALDDGRTVRATQLLIGRFGLVPVLDLTDASLRDALGWREGLSPSCEQLDALAATIGTGFRTLANGVPTYPVLLVHKDGDRGHNGICIDELNELIAALRATQPVFLFPLEIRRLAIRFEASLQPESQRPFVPAQLQRLRIY